MSTRGHDRDCKLPGYNNERVQSIPRLRHISTTRAAHAHRDHLDQHLDREEYKYKIVKRCKGRTGRRHRKKTQEEDTRRRLELRAVLLLSRQLPCKILQRDDTQTTSAHGWYMPSVMQLRIIAIIDTRSNHVLLETARERREERAANAT